MAADALIRRARPLLGTIVEIAVDPESTCAIEAGFAIIRHIHERMSFHDAGSDLTRLRAMPAMAVCAVDPQTLAVLRIAADLHRQSNGLFDITIGRALVRGGFLPRQGVSHLNHYCGTAADIEIRGDGRICLHRPVLIDLGGIAKGHAVDCAVAALQAAGARRGIVNAGGDLRVFGDHAAAIEIRQADGQLSLPFRLRDAAIASSENRRNRRHRQGRIETPHIGPNRTGIAIDHTISVIASTAIIADAITKVAMVDTAIANHILARHDGHVVAPAQRLAA